MKNIVPVLLGTDINAYSMTRTFHEAYGVKSYIIGKMYSGPIKNSKIIEKVILEPNIEQNERFLEIILPLGKELKSKGITPFIFACGDNYIRLVTKNKDALSKYFIVPFIDDDLADKLILKENFYKLCDEYNIDYPKTFSFDCNSDLNIEDINLNFPLIIKPSNSVTYWDFPFEGQEKVFLANDLNDGKRILNDILKSGYRDGLIFQEFIPGSDDHMYVLTCYSNQRKKVVMTALGHVLLEEHTPKGKGNHAAILSDENDVLVSKLSGFLESIGYIGFSNFDIKYDERDKKYKVFEVNLRQGRSNYYVTGGGINIAKLPVEDYLTGESIQPTKLKVGSLWTMLPHGVIYKYVSDNDLKNTVKKLIKSHNVTHPLEYNKDKNLKRSLYINLAKLNQFKKFKKYF